MSTPPQAPEPENRPGRERAESSPSPLPLRRFLKRLPDLPLAGRD